MPTEPSAADDIDTTNVAASADVAAVTRQLGRVPLAPFVVVVRAPNGDPVVVRNDPFLVDGTPMPTRYYLVDPALNQRVSRLESNGGVRSLEAIVDPSALERAHSAYAAERDAAIPVEHVGARPFGGVGGTRTGVKCLHAHYAYWLAGGDDPIGRLVDAALTAEQEPTRCE